MSERVKAASEKKVYQRPQIRVLGSVREMTRGVVSGESDGGQNQKGVGNIG